MNFIAKILASIALLLAFPAMAGTYSGLIVQFTAKSDGIIYISMNGNTGHASCSGASTYWAIKDETTVAGKTQASALLSAFQSGRTVVITGLSTCTRISGVEDISQVDVL